jgi:ribosomal protein S18 acetylase RimI-like enzyme
VGGDTCATVVDVRRAVRKVLRRHGGRGTMDGTCTIRRATPADAAAFARSQIDAWRAAYDGILPAEFLAALDHDRMTARWERSLTSPGEGVSQLALCTDGQVVGWSGFGAPRDEVGDGVGEIHAINLSTAYWSRGLGSLLFAQSVRDLAAMGYRACRRRDQGRRRFHPATARTPDGISRPHVELSCRAFLLAARCARGTLPA